MMCLKQMFTSEPMLGTANCLVKGLTVKIRQDSTAISHLVFSSQIAPKERLTFAIRIFIDLICCN